MTKAFNISKVFKTSEFIALMDERSVENSTVSPDQNLYDTSAPSVSGKRKEIFSPSISSESFHASGESSLHLGDPISSNSAISNVKESSGSKNDCSIPIMYSIRGSLSEEYKLCDSSSPMENSDIPCFPTSSDGLSTNIPCYLQLEAAFTHSSPFLTHNQLQLLMQDWMEITICKVSNFLRSIYQCFIEENINPIRNPSESSPDVSKITII